MNYKGDWGKDNGGKRIDPGSGVSMTYAEPSGFQGYFTESYDTNPNREYFATSKQFCTNLA
jgi:hypothetical protein